jgi:hypothetical protein
MITRSFTITLARFIEFDLWMPVLFPAAMIILLLLAYVCTRDWHKRR